MSIVTETLGDIRLDEPLAYRNLTLFPLIRPVDGPPEYLTLDQAMADSSIKISEVSESGNVPDIRFENTGNKPTLLVDGEEISGGKQNRILNISILAPAKETITIPVTCVEAGRWGRHDSAYRRERERILRSRHRAEFEEADHIAFMRMRRAKHVAVTQNLKVAGSRYASQAEVWSEIEDLDGDMGTRSPTRAMRDSYETHRQSLEQYVQALPAVKDQVGVVFALNNQPVGLDLFDHPHTLSRILPKLVRSHAMEALREPESVAEVASTDAARDFIGEIVDAATTRYPAIGEGEDLRLESNQIVGGGLEARERLIHLCAFVEGREPKDPTRSRRSRFWTHRSASRRPN